MLAFCPDCDYRANLDIDDPTDVCPICGSFLEAA